MLTTMRPVTLVSVTLTVFSLATVTFGQVAAIPAPPPDPRLDQKVTLTVTAMKLADVLDQLAKQTGIYLHAGTGQQDWKVREQRVSVVAKEVPLRTLIGNFSEVLRFRVSTGKKDGKTSYLFWQDRNQRDLEAALLNSQAEAGTQRAIAVRQAALDSADEALKMTPQQIEAAKKDDPWLGYLGGTKSGRSSAQVLQQLSHNYPDFRDLMLRGKRARLNMSDASPEMQQAVRGLMGSWSTLMRGKNGPEPFSDFTPFALVAAPTGDARSTEVGMGGMLTVLARVNKPADARPDDVDSSGGVPLGMMPLASKGSFVGRMIGKMFISIDSGKSPEEAQRSLQDEFRDPKLLAEMLGKQSRLEQKPPHEPWLLREVDWNYDELDLLKQAAIQADAEAQMLQHLSTVVALPLVVETYPNSFPPTAFISKGKQPLYHLLIAAEKTGWGWQLSKGTLELKPEDWALERSYMIPEATLKQYRALLQKNGTLELDELAALLAGLSDGQILHTLTADEELMPVVLPAISGMFGSGGIDLFRLYGGLSSAQKQALASDSGLKFADLSPQQYDQLLDLVAGSWGGAEITGGVLKMSMASLGHSNNPPTDAKSKPTAEADAVRIARFKFVAELASDGATDGGKPATRKFETEIALPSKASLAQTRKNIAEARKQMAKSEKKGGAAEAKAATGPAAAKK